MVKNEGFAVSEQEVIDMLGEKSLTVQDLACMLGVPVYEVRSVLLDLKRRGEVMQVNTIEYRRLV